VRYLEAMTKAVAAEAGSNAAIPSRKTIAVVIPVFNEVEVLDALVQQLVEVLDGKDFLWNVLFVDDGSSDGTFAKLQRLNTTDHRFTAISFSRNFGKEIAIAAGLSYASGDAVILMDADMQHPPSLIPTLIARWREGYKVVFAQRESRDADGWLRRLYSRVFHAVFRRIAGSPLPTGIVDFLILDRRAVDTINRLGERTRFSKGLYVWIGFSSTTVPFVSGDRLIGTSHWSFWKLCRLALDGFVSFSVLPLKIWSYIGATISLAAIGYALYFLVRTLIFGADLPGFPSLIVSITFFAGVQLVSLGVIGEYVARMYEEVKARPLYVVAEEIGIVGPPKYTTARVPSEPTE
jgi:glycosyltransferase involved in cell wall biosynthesis